MQLGHAESAWAHTSSVLALIANCHRDAKRRPRPFAASDFNPLKRQRSDAIEINAETKGDFKRLVLRAIGKEKHG